MFGDISVKDTIFGIYVKSRENIKNTVLCRDMKENKGTQHPLWMVIQEIVQIFSDLGFSVANGPEMEDEFHNFDALNIPANHPSRATADTLWVKDLPGMLMRTHTSPVQIRYMENNPSPFAIIVPGKVFRNESTDATHEIQFHQVEGLLVGKDISLAHLKGTLYEFFKRFLGPETEIRFRPSFFPFVEPGIEVDVKFKGAWLEVLGAGMVHPNVFKAVGYDPEVVSGFAFGMGIDRLANLKTQTPDVRYYYQGDVRVNQW
jgi:phenylalanyl-tRNA synthetase alpha chain